MSISSYIKKDLTVRLQSEPRLGLDQLTLDSLATHYNVSFTPVRTAVAELIDDGLLERGPDRRLRASRRRRSIKKGQTRPPDPPRDVYQMVADNLIELSFRGEAVCLREEATAERFGISRSAIRNIFHRLAGEGLLDHIPRRGWRLQPFHIKDLRAFTEVRALLEVKAMELARPRLELSVLQQMLEANAPPETPDEQAYPDESLHDYLITLADNRYISDFFGRRRRYFKLLGDYEGKNRDVLLETRRQHRGILSALIEQDFAAATDALSNHILNHHPVLHSMWENGCALARPAADTRLNVPLMAK